MIGRRLARSGPHLTPFPVATSLIACLVLIACACPAAAQNLGDNIRTASNVGPFTNQIQSFVQERVARLVGTDPAAQSKAREELVAQVVGAPPAAGAGGAGTGGAGGGAGAQPPGVQPSPQFLASYAGILNNELAKVVQHKDARVRLNIAIVAAKVAQGAKNAALLPVTQTLLKDTNDGVVLWALRAAGSVLPASIIGGGGDAVLPVVVQIGQNRPSVIAEVYRALARPNPDAKVLAAVVPAMHTVMQARINQWVNGVPSDIAPEALAAVYLTTRDEWRAQPAALKVATVQSLSDMLGVVAQRAGDVDNERRRELVELVKALSGAIAVVGQWENSAPVQAAGTDGARLPINATPADIRGKIQPILPALRGVRMFAKLNDPPKVKPMPAGDAGGSPPPATASTGPAGGR